MVQCFWERYIGAFKSYFTLYIQPSHNFMALSLGPRGDFRFLISKQLGWGCIWDIPLVVTSLCLKSLVFS